MVTDRNENLVTYKYVYTLRILPTEAKKFKFFETHVLKIGGNANF